MILEIARMATDGAGRGLGAPRAPQGGVWSHVLARYKRKPCPWPTPGAYAKAMDPKLVQTRVLDLIDEALVKLADTPDGRLAISIAPQEGKSQRCSRRFPAWLLARNPELRIGIISYEHSVARRWGRAIRDDIRTHEEQFDLRIRDDVSAQDEWQLENHEGGVVSVGIGGAINGRPVDVLIIDDPFKSGKEAASPTTRENVWQFWQDVGMPRLAPGGIVLIVMTRWHEDDLVGRLINPPEEEEDIQDGFKPHDWVELNIKARCEDEDDPLGREIGEYFESARGRTVEQWMAREAATEPKTWEALYQGNPSVREGELFKTANWKHLRPGELPPVGPDSDFFQSWDLTFKGKPTSDYVVGGFWVATGANMYLLDVVRRRMGAGQTIQAIQDMKKKWPMTRAILIEDKANGSAVMDLLADKIPGLIPVQPLGDKYARANAAEPFHRAGNLWLPNEKDHAWVKRYIKELAAFPNDKYDDQVDMTSQAVVYRMIPRGTLGHKVFNIG